MNLRLQLLTGCVALLAIATTAPAQNLVTNPSFEAGSGTDIDNWVLLPTAEGRTVADYPTATGTSPYGPRFLSFNADLLNTPGGNATHDFGPLDSNQEYLLTFAYAAIGTDGDQTLLVTINRTSIPLEFTPIVVAPSGTDFSTIWQRATLPFSTELDNIPFGITFTDFGVTLLGDTDLLIDDVSIVAVPEPASLSLLAIAGIVFLRRRRSRCDS